MTTAELQYKLIYSIVVAGKSAKFADAVMGRLMACFCGEMDLFDRFQLRFDLCPDESKEKSIRDLLVIIRSGNYTKLAKAIVQLVEVNPDLATCTPADLERIYGIGPKTSRFFIIWTRPEARYAALDVHILRWMRQRGHAVPKTTPQSIKRYRAIEELFLAEADKRNMTPRELDHEIWMAGSKYSGVVQSL